MRFAECLRGALLLAAVGAAGCATRPEDVPTAAAQPPPVAEKDGAANATAAGAPAAEVPPAARLAFERATAALNAGRIDEAEREFAALAQSHPGLGGPLANLGLIHRRAGRIEQAVAPLEQAVRANPRQPAYLNQLGIAYRELGRFADARKAYEAAIALDPQYAAAQLNLGILLDLYLWDSDGALAAYERYLALAGEGDGKVRKWVAELRNRKPPPQLAGIREPR
jgi:Flp pilus assembly protein TadD